MKHVRINLNGDDLVLFPSFSLFFICMRVGVSLRQTQIDVFI